MKRIFHETSWPKPNARLEAALGRFVIAWGILEQELDYAIHQICRLDFIEGMSVTANLGTKAKLDMLQSLAHALQSAVLDQSFPATVNQLAADTGDASGNLRNFLFHGQPQKIQISPKRQIDSWVRFSARKGGVKGTLTHLSAASVDKDTKHIKDLIERWTSVRRSIQRAIEIKDFVDSETREEEPPEFSFTLQSHAKRAAPSQPSHPRRQPQSSRGSPKAKKKPPQSSQG